MTNALRENIPVLLALLEFVAYALGLVSIGYGTKNLMGFSSDPRSQNIGKPVGELFFGGALLSNSFWIPMLVTSVTGEDLGSASNILSYSAQTGGSEMENLFRVVISFAQLLGIFAILRGIHLLRRASNASGGGQQQGEDAAYAGLSFIFFGAMAANFRWTLTMAAQFFNFKVPDFLL